MSAKFIDPLLERIQELQAHRACVLHAYRKSIEDLLVNDGRSPQTAKALVEKHAEAIEGDFKLNVPASCVALGIIRLEP